MSGRNKNNKKNKEEQKVPGETLIEVKKEYSDPEETLAENKRVKEPAEGKQDQTPEGKLQVQLAEKTREAAENFDKWLRLRAELENFKKRTQKEKDDHIKYCNESLLKSMLPILDNLERAIDHGKKDGESEPLLEGVEIVHRMFLGTLEKVNVKPIPTVGEVFDPEKHEAVSQEESDQEPNRVISEVQRGYFFHERLLRPAKVIVSKAKAE